MRLQNLHASRLWPIQMLGRQNQLFQLLVHFAQVLTLFANKLVQTRVVNHDGDDDNDNYVNNDRALML